MTISTAGFPDDFNENFRRMLQGLTPDFSRSVRPLIDTSFIDEITKPARESAQQAATVAAASVQPELLGMTEKMVADLQELLFSAMPDVQEVATSMLPTLDLFASTLESQADEIEQGIRSTLKEIDEITAEDWLEGIAENETEQSRKLRERLTGRFWRTYIWKDEKFEHYSEKALQGLRVFYWAIAMTFLGNTLYYILIMTGHPELASRMIASVGQLFTSEATSPSQDRNRQEPQDRWCPTCKQPPGERCVTVGGKSPGTPTNTHMPRKK